MMETIAQIFGMTFIGVIGLCMLWTIGSSISSSRSPNSKLEENIRKFDKNTRDGR